MTTPSPLKQLKHIRELLGHPAMDRDEISRRVDKIYKEVAYLRHPYDLGFEGVHRASVNMDEAWFYESDGHTPDINKLHCPPDHIATLQRCNWAGDPVFYCSIENGVPVFEVRAKQDATVVITVWISRRNSKQEVEQYAAGGPLAHQIDIKGLAVGVERIIDSMKPDDPMRAVLLDDDIFDPNMPEVIREIDRYVGELFTESVNDVPNLYWFTSAIARVLLRKMANPDTRERLDGFIYPSVESRFSGYNIALKKTFARNELIVYGASMYKVMEYDPNEPRYSLKPIRSLASDPVRRVNLWKNVHPKHDKERFDLTTITPTLWEPCYLDLED